MADFEIIKCVKGNTLPTYLKDAVCILTAGQDLWATAYGAFILAKQAGLDITYAWHLDEIPQSPVYMLPNLCGLAAIEGHVLSELLRRVENGATLYVSLGNALMSPFSSYTGVKVKTRRAFETRTDSPGETPEVPQDPCQHWRGILRFRPDRKSTRLNSSHPK